MFHRVSMNSRGAPLSREVKLLADIFRMFDLDGSGEIDLGEIAKAFKSTGKFTDETRAQLEAHFAFMDSDGSGAIDRQDELYFTPSSCYCVEFATYTNTGCRNSCIILQELQQVLEYSSGPAIRWVFLVCHDFLLNKADCAFVITRLVADPSAKDMAGFVLFRHHPALFQTSSSPNTNSSTAVYSPCHES